MLRVCIAASLHLESILKLDTNIFEELLIDFHIAIILALQIFDLLFVSLDT